MRLFWTAVGGSGAMPAAVIRMFPALPSVSTSFTQLEPEFVKLDMELIRDIHLHKMKRKIVRSMVQLCHDMGKSIIGEGVEICEEAEVLVELECDYLQGFLFAKPDRTFPRITVPPPSVR